MWKRAEHLETNQFPSTYIWKKYLRTKCPWKVLHQRSFFLEVCCNATFCNAQLPEKFHRVSSEMQYNIMKSTREQLAQLNQIVFCNSKRPVSSSSSRWLLHWRTFIRWWKFRRCGRRLKHEANNFSYVGQNKSFILCEFEIRAVTKKCIIRSQSLNRLNRSFEWNCFSECDVVSRKAASF